MDAEGTMDLNGIIMVMVDRFVQEEMNTFFDEINEKESATEQDLGDWTTVNVQSGRLQAFPDL